MTVCSQAGSLVEIRHSYYSSGGGKVVIFQKLKMKESERCGEDTLPLLSSAGVVFIFKKPPPWCVPCCCH